VGCRAWRRLSCDAFAADLEASRLCTDLNELNALPVDELAQLYYQVSTDLLDQHCPVVHVRRRSRPPTLWFDADCRGARRRVRAAERRFRRTRSNVDRCAWTDKLKALRALYEERNNSYWRGEIAASGGNSKKLWRTLNSVLGDDRTNEASELSADEFATFFQDNNNNNNNRHIYKAP